MVTIIQIAPFDKDRIDITFSLVIEHHRRGGYGAGKDIFRIRAGGVILNMTGQDDRGGVDQPGIEHISAGEDHHRSVQGFILGMGDVHRDVLIILLVQSQEVFQQITSAGIREGGLAAERDGGVLHRHVGKDINELTADIDHFADLGSIIIIAEELVCIATVQQHQHHGDTGQRAENVGFFHGEMSAVFRWHILSDVIC